MVTVSPVEPGRVRLQLLDVFRFVAAFSVIAYHWLFRGIETGNLTSVSYSPLAEVASYGYLGVYLFFMISGFVIAASAQSGSPSRFAVGRLVRLYPAFWVAVLVTATVTAVWGGPELTVTLRQVLTNLTMVPSALDQPLVDGSYWTLFHELLFYAMVFVVLLVGQGRRLDALFPAWAIGMAVVTLLAPGLATRPFLGTIYGFFAAGAILSTIHRRGWGWWQVVGLLATLYVVTSYVIRDVPRLNGDSRPFEQSVTTTVVVVLCFYVLLLIQIAPGVSRWVIPRSALLGQLTYPIYLIHTYFGYILINHVGGQINKWIAYTIALATVGLMAYGLHVLVERRMRAQWFRFFDVIAGHPIRWVEARFGRRRLKTDSGQQARSVV